MKRNMIGPVALTGILSVALIDPHARAQAQCRDPSDIQEHLLSQILEVRADLLEYLQDAENRKIKDLALDLDRVQREQRRRQEEDAQRVQQINEIQRQLASPELEQTARPQIEEIGARLANEEAQRLRDERARLAQKETDLIQQMNREMQRSRQLQERAVRFQAARIKPQQ